MFLGGITSLIIGWAEQAGYGVYHILGCVDGGGSGFSGHVLRLHAVISDGLQLVRGGKKSGKLWVDMWLGSCEAGEFCSQPSVRLGDAPGSIV